MIKYSDLLKHNATLSEELQSNDSYDITVLANITVNQLSDVLEYHVRKRGVNAQIKNGDFDNIVQNSQKFADSQCVIIFWEIANFIEGFDYKADLMSEEQLDALENKVKSEMIFVFENLRKTPLVLFNLFGSLDEHQTIHKQDRLNELAGKLNKFAIEQASSNVSFVNLKEIKAACLKMQALDYRFYRTAKAPYTIEFFINYSQYVLPVIMLLCGKAKKAIIFDCDNTLWKGILGEDGIEGILMSANNKGRVFEEVQYLAKKLRKQGVLIGLCSKNNSEDVAEVFNSHADIILQNEDIAVRRVNWQDKADNLLEISKELNIGLDSMVFVDDSEFEVENIRARIPELTVIQVPKKLYEYPQAIKKAFSLFYSHSLSEEDKQKTQMYATENKRKSSQESFADITEYLKSLDLRLAISLNSVEQIPRISQLTQKTNQFNLTTKRYSENEIENFTESDDYIVYSFSLEDKFGSYGLTGLSIVELHDKNARIDTFLMSCRVIGRNIELSFSDYIITDLIKKGIEKVEASYIKTEKNAQVKLFWEQLGFSKNGEKYALASEKYRSQEINYIKSKQL